MIYADKPRKYSKRGKRWSHIFSPCKEELLGFAKNHGLKRRDASPWLHFDVTEEELAKLLPDIKMVSKAQVFVIMKDHR